MQILMLVLIIILIVILLYNIYIMKKNETENKYNKDLENERLKSYFKENSYDIYKEINKQILDFKDGISKNILENIDSLTQKVDLKLEDNNKVSKGIDNSINLFKENIKENISKDVNNLSTKVNDNLKENFKISNETIKEVISRLSKIDEAQKNIESLSKEITELQNTLNDKKSRGTFGEGQLEQLLEYVYGQSGLYERQFKLSTNVKADAIIYIMGKILAIDSKFPLENYKKFMESKLLEDRKNFINDVKKHIKDISNKYIIENETLNQAIMFIPSESIFLEIYSNFEEIINFSLENKVWLASKTNLMIYISTMQYVSLEIKKVENSKIILENLSKLSEEFKRFNDRWLVLEKDMKKIEDDFQKISTTHLKISRKFDEISYIEEK